MLQTFRKEMFDLMPKIRALADTDIGTWELTSHFSFQHTAEFQEKYASNCFIRDNQNSEWCILKHAAVKKLYELLPLVLNYGF